MIQKVQKYHQHIFCKSLGLNSMGHLFSQFSSWCERKMLANIGPRGEHIAAQSTWIQNSLLNVKNDSLLAKFNKSRKSFLDIP